MESGETNIGSANRRGICFRLAKRFAAQDRLHRLRVTLDGPLRDDRLDPDTAADQLHVRGLG